MYVDDVGNGPPILALHGLGGGAYFFRGFAARVQAHARVLAVDLPGTGLSGPGGPEISMDGWIAALGALVHERCTDRVVIVGHSMGTILALKAWAAWPDRIRAMVFVGGLPEVRPLIRGRLEQRLTALDGAQTLAGWGARVAPGVFSPITLREQPEIVAMYERLFELQPIASYVRSCRLLLDGSATAIVPTVNVPCLAITGADDQYAPPDAVAAFIDGIPAGASLRVLPDCGHLPFLEQPAAFALAVEAFMRSC